MKYGTTKPGITAAASWQEGSVISFTYDGTYWQMNDQASAIETLDSWKLAISDNGVMNTNKTITIPVEIWKIANEFNIIVTIRKSTSYSGTFTFNVPKDYFG
jgi:hypothetical protein